MRTRPTLVCMCFYVTLYATDCGKYYEEIRKLQLNLAEREQFYQNQCGQQEKVEAMLRGDLDRWKKETLYYKTKLNGKYGTYIMLFIALAIFYWHVFLT